jgi:class 3 adenylate cyclase
MTLEQLQSKVKELEALINSDKDYAQAETYARELLATLSPFRAEPDHKLKIVETRILLALCTSLWQRGISKDALPYAVKALELAEKAENKSLQAKAWNILGNISLHLSDFTRSLEYFGKALLACQELGEHTNAASINNGIGNVYRNISDYPRALEYYIASLSACEELGDLYGASIATINIGTVYAFLAEYSRALEYYIKALAAHEQMGNRSAAALVTGNIGNVYAHLTNYHRALEYYGKALAAHKELGDKLSAAIIHAAIGSVYNLLADYPRALEYHGQALAAHEELGNKSNAANSVIGIGVVYENLSDYPLALEYYGKALAAYEELGDKSGVAAAIGNIGEVYAKADFQGFDAIKAEAFLLQAIALSTEIGSKHHLTYVYKRLADLYEKNGRDTDALNYFKKHYELEKEVQSEEAKKQAERLDFERKTAEREKQLAIERATAANERKILNNILPEEITTRLIKGENPIADHFDCVSILFMDIVDFTKLSATITAQQLVHLLNSIFTAADSVMRQFGLEKIKTIGDAYMAVAGAPIVQEDHALRAAQAALQLLDTMEHLVVHFPEEYGDRSWIASIPEIKVRIGLHCGPVAAGVVGENKFLYDLWGDAVNTAARMESHGEAGRIHVSEEFAMHLTSLSQNLSQTLSKGEGFSFPLGEVSVERSRNGDGVLLPRGEIEIKGKGMMRTYFLERA